MLQSAAAVATILSAVMTFYSLINQPTRNSSPSRRRGWIRLNRREILLISCIILFFIIGLAFPQSILPIFVVLIVMVCRNMPKSKDKAHYLMSLLVATLSGLVGAYLSAFETAAKVGLPIYYDHDFKMFDIWYLLQ